MTFFPRIDLSSILCRVFVKSLFIWDWIVVNLFEEEIVKANDSCVVGDLVVSCAMVGEEVFSIKLVVSLGESF